MKARANFFRNTLVNMNLRERFVKMIKTLAKNIIPEVELSALRLGNARYNSLQWEFKSSNNVYTCTTKIWLIRSDFVALADICFIVTSAPLQSKCFVYPYCSVSPSDNYVNVKACSRNGAEPLWRIQWKKHPGSSHRAFLSRSTFVSWLVKSWQICT